MAARKKRRKKKSGHALRVPKPKHLKKTKRRPKRRKPFLQKSELVRMVVIIPALVLLFLLILLVQQSRVHGLKGEILLLKTQLADLETQVEFYREAYSVTLQDMRILSAAYGGDERYERLATELREKELGTVLGIELDDVHSLANVELWEEYREKGVVDDSCLATPVPVQTKNDEVLVQVTVSAESSLYIDGNYLLQLVPGEHVLNVQLDNGVYELSLIAKEGGEITALSLETEEYPLEFAVFDTGNSWEVFDCQHITRSTTGEGSGAFRLRFEKR